MSEITYNGYTFGNYSHVRMTAESVEDEAGRTVMYQRYHLRVDTLIVAEAQDAYTGNHFERIRRLLSKQGGELIIDHDGFGRRMVINARNGGGTRDVEFGPKPRVLSWNPVGHEVSVEVEWELTFAVPSCDGYTLFGRTDGVMAINYGVSYRIDHMGITSRTITGHLMIAMSAKGRSIPDSADAYRDRIITTSPANYTRESSWHLSTDKRRADFTIVDSEIASPNGYPAGVVSIRATHGVQWARAHLATLPNYLRASITLEPGQPRGRAWEIFRGLVVQRTGAARAGQAALFWQSLEVVEEIYEHTLSFSCSWKMITNGSANNSFFQDTGLFLKTPDQWSSWKASISKIQTHRGIGGLKHVPTDDQIVDLCTNSLLKESPYPLPLHATPSTTYQPFCNRKPNPQYSWLVFQSNVQYIDHAQSYNQVTMGADDLQTAEAKIEGIDGDTFEVSLANGVTRFLEEQAPKLEIEWAGFARRVGYPIPQPGRIRFGGITLVRHGKGQFVTKPAYMSFCQPVYEAAWRYRYIVDNRKKATDKEVNPVLDFKGDEG